jgi:proline-specific peptidase
MAVLRLRLNARAVAAFAIGCIAASPRLAFTQAAARPREGYVTTPDSARLYYRVAGTRGDTLIAIHGGPGVDLESIAGDFAPLSQRHVVIFYDQRGAGRSTLPRDTTTLNAAQQVRDLDAVRRFFGLSRVTLVAHSYGPLLAASYAIAHPDVVRRMVFFGPVPPRRGDFWKRFGQSLNLRLDSTQRTRLAEVARRLGDTTVDARAACRDYWALAMRPRLAEPERTLSLIKSDLCASDPAGIRYGLTTTNRLVMGSYGDWNLRTALGAVPAPTLVVHGEEEAIPMDLVTEWMTALPHARLLRVPRAAHFTYAERPELAWPAVEAFLAETEQPTAQEHAHAPLSEQLGTVHFATSCSPAVAPTFDRAIALLHSFEFGASIRTFNQVLDADSTCAMAHWGIALSRWSNPMSAGNRSTSALESGRQAANAAARLAGRTLAGRATDGERGYVDAVAQLYADYEHRDQRTRIVAYERAMADLVAKQPADTEAQIFHAIALVASAPPTDKTYAKQIEAGAILEKIWERQPNHPGLAHYIIHAYDVPALAARARVAAARYSQIAPSAAHALHMPSHTFTRVGQWQESVNSNLRSIAEAKRTGAIAEALHAADYATYAYLQTLQDSMASRILDSLPAYAARFDVNAVTGAAPGSAGVFALAAIPARYALERRDWKMAASLRPTTSPFPYADALTWFARALGASRLGDTAGARAGIDSLTAMRERLLVQKEAYWAEQVAIARLGAQAWLDLAERRREEAVTHMREASVREDATEKSAVTPGPLAPAHELMGDLLTELGRPAEALAEYRLTLTKEPGRFRSLYGAMLAARATGDRAIESQYASELEVMTHSREYARH